MKSWLFCIALLITWTLCVWALSGSIGYEKGRADEQAIQTTMLKQIHAVIVDGRCP